LPDEVGTAELLGAATVIVGPDPPAKALPAVSVGAVEIVGISVPAGALEFVYVRTYGPAPEPLVTTPVHPVPVPVFESVDVTRPVTLSENVTEKVAEVREKAVFVNVETVGAVMSRVIVVDDVAAAAGPVFDEASVAPLIAKRGWIVPAEQPVIVTVRVAPLSVPGSYTQPVAVPAFEKSPAATPVTDSENVSV
jgi:hypothetical protein